MRYFALLSSACCFLMAESAFAQLPSNPWAAQPTSNTAVTAGASTSSSESVASAAQRLNAPMAPSADSRAADYSDILPVDPWARARDYSGTTSWRGSAQHGKLDYTGEATTWGTAYGQEMIAPEVNRHNMVVMTQHFRDLGYKIPADYDEKIMNMPQAYGKILRNAYDDIGHGSSPLDTMFAGMLDAFEDGTGLDVENLLFNSIDLLSTD